LTTISLEANFALDDLKLVFKCRTFRIPAA
jgi:hypothetical protein